MDVVFLEFSKVKGFRSNFLRLLLKERKNNTATVLFPNINKPKI